MGCDVKWFLEPANSARIIIPCISTGKIRFRSNLRNGSQFDKHRVDMISSNLKQLYRVPSENWRNSTIFKTLIIAR
ncbi:MAG TPA: hypothetical protein DD473_15610 [Planctomycetaceae bacterium]|nr:hypothetical protein [Planctomycetaceae bacterium]